jgi:hypothetical protein
MSARGFVAAGQHAAREQVPADFPDRLTGLLAAYGAAPDAKGWTRVIGALCRLLKSVGADHWTLQPEVGPTPGDSR